MLIKTKQILSTLIIISLFARCTAPSSKVTESVRPSKTENSIVLQNAAVIIDVRTPEEYASGHLDGAINIPHDKIKDHLSELSRWKNDEVVVYCKSGRRAGIAKAALQQDGFQNVVNAGGYTDLNASK